MNNKNIMFDELPLVLENREQILKKLENKKPAIFLDYDGTLTPIVKRPEDAKLSGEMRAVLKHLAKLTLIAVVSGRDRADVKNLVALDGLIYAGSHGFDITGPGEMHLQYEGGNKCLPSLDSAEKELESRLNHITGAQVERKKYSVAVHYRNAPEEKLPEITSQTEEVLQAHPDLKKGLGKKIIELKPDINWDKGRAVFWLLEKLRLDNSAVIPIYIGDDLTDEDAFRAMEERGIGILVGDHGEPTFASYGLINVDEVRQFLTELVKFLENSA